MILKSAPEGADVLDLTSIRAARAEAKKDQPNPVVKLSAGYVELRKELDVTSSDDFVAGRVSAGLAKILADPADLAELVKGGFSREDLDSITTFITGRSLGE